MSGSGGCTLPWNCPAPGERKLSESEVREEAARTLAALKADSLLDIFPQEQPPSMEESVDSPARRKRSRAIPLTSDGVCPMRMPSCESNDLPIFSIGGISPSHFGSPPMSPRPESPTDDSENSRSRSSSSVLMGPGTSSTVFGRKNSPTSELDRIGPEKSFPAKHVETEQFMTKHTLKAKMSKYQTYLDRAFDLVLIGTPDAILEGCKVIHKVMLKSWLVPKIGHELAYGLCSYVLEMGRLDALIRSFVDSQYSDDVKLIIGKCLEECMSSPNRDHIAKNQTLLSGVVSTAKSLSDRLQGDLERAEEALRLSVSLMEALFKHSTETSFRLMEMSCLDHILAAIKASSSGIILRHAALALANLAMYSDKDCQQKMAEKQVQDWLFLLASLQDDVSRYYACFAICTLVSNKEIENAVLKSGTLSLVEPFLQNHKPAAFAAADLRHSHGRPIEWLQRLVPMLNSKRSEARGLAAFHFAMEAGIKKDQQNTEVFQEVGAIEALKQVGSSPDEVPAKLARMALTIIGEDVPYKLSQQVPLWSVEDVEYWVSKIGFPEFAETFRKQKVDGDLLLLLSDEELEMDIGMGSKILRRRFRRELDSLKIAADYSSIDETQLDRFLMTLSPYLSVYTYDLLEMGIDVSLLPMLTDEILTDVVRIHNPIHRFRILQAAQEYAQCEDMEVAILKKHIEIFISYRRSTGSQLASLIKVLLQLRAHKVFIDVDRLSAGKFDASLLKNIRAAEHFVLVLTPGALDRCLDDLEGTDWLHREVICAIEHRRNIIPVFDPAFDWPTEEARMPPAINALKRYNGVRWVHEYQEACVSKLERFIRREESPPAAAPSVAPPHLPRVLSVPTPRPPGPIRPGSKISLPCRGEYTHADDGSLRELSDLGAF